MTQAATTPEIIRARRAVKQYDPAHKLTAAEEKELFDLAQQTPSSFNIQHWRIVKVTDKVQREKLREAAWGQPQVTDASLLLVLCADVKAWEKQPERYWQTAPQEVKDFLIPKIHELYAGRAQLQRDEALRSVGMIAQTLMLSAKAMGYDSSPMIGCDIEMVSKIINLPEDHVLGMLLAIGKGTAPARPKGGYLSREEIVIENSF